MVQGQVCFITLLHLANEHDLEITLHDHDAPDDSMETSDDALLYPSDLLVHAGPREALQ